MPPYTFHPRLPFVPILYAHSSLLDLQGTLNSGVLGIKGKSVENCGSIGYKAMGGSQGQSKVALQSVGGENRENSLPQHHSLPVTA